MHSRLSIGRTLGVALLLAGFVAAPASVAAFGDGTPDEQPPAEELPCDSAGLFGAAYGLCIAYCEANDCEIQPDKHACDVLRGNYLRITGTDLFPCESTFPEDPM
jgi:hypothetical protein